MPEKANPTAHKNSTPKFDKRAGVDCEMRRNIIAAVVSA
jgi:hypothetical protein